MIQLNEVRAVHADCLFYLRQTRSRRDGSGEISGGGGLILVIVL
jgi:hypothetical protein